MRKASPSISILSPGRGFATSATRRSIRVVSDQSRASPKSLIASARRATAVSDVDRVPADVGIGEECANGGGESAHQNAAFRRTRPMVSPAPLATASTATPMRVLSVATVVQRLLVSSQ